MSNKTPEGFQVTDIALQKSKNDATIKFKKEKNPEIQITLNGFYATNLEKASALITQFKRILSSSGQFKSIDFSNPKKSKKYKTYYTINMVY